MTPDDVRAAAEQLVQFHERFAPLFGKAQAQDHAYDYLKGLMICPERKSIEPIALLVGHGDVSGLQKFVGAAPWQDDEVMAEAQSLFVDELAPSAAGSAVGVVGVIDESAFAKKGAHSAGVARQHNGRLGKQDNCQVGVFLVGVTPAGSALLAHRLFLPESWCEPTRPARTRRARAHIPEDVEFRTKPRIAAELVRELAVLGQVELDWVVADEEYGRAGHFLDELEALGQRYVVEVPVTTAVWTADPAGCVPASSGRGRPPTAAGPGRGADGGGGGRRAARLRLAGAAGARGGGRPAGLRVRRGAGLVDEAPQAGPAGLAADPPLAGGAPELKYFVSNAGAETPLGTLALVCCTRHRVEDFFEDGKSYLGMAQYETRSWVGWHHHMTLVGLAHLFVTSDAAAAQKKVPELTLDRTVRLLEAAWEEPGLRLERAIELVDYHVRRNKVAKASHDKTWKKKHKKVKFLRL